MLLSFSDSFPPFPTVSRFPFYFIYTFVPESAGKRVTVRLNLLPNEASVESNATLLDRSPKCRPRLQRRAEVLPRLEEAVLGNFYTRTVRVRLMRFANISIRARARCEGYREVPSLCASTAP